MLCVEKGGMLSRLGREAGEVNCVAIVMPFIWTCIIIKQGPGFGPGTVTCSENQHVGPDTGMFGRSSLVG